MPEFRALLDGYRRFRADAYQGQRLRWSDLAEGQAPPVMVIGCCDSRVDPGMIFDTAPGQAFVLRNVANLVPPCEAGGGLHGVSAAIEFAVRSLAVRHIVVLGHARCGGVAAALALREPVPGQNRFIEDWVSILGPARDRVLLSGATDKQEALELEAIRVSLTNLRSFACVREREDAGELKLHGAYFSIAAGELRVLTDDGVFEAA
jgi:carbonic anhydrase